MTVQVIESGTGEIMRVLDFVRGPSRADQISGQRKALRP